MSFRLATFFLMALFAVSTKAAMPARTLLQSTPCERACDAVGRTDPNTLQTIINAGNNLCNCTCGTSGQPLMHASVAPKCFECIENLISPPSNCPKDTRDNNGNTALHTAASQCRIEMVKELLRMNFPVDRQNSVYNTPLCVASRTASTDCGEIVKRLIDDGANPCVDCSDNQTPCEGCTPQGVCNDLSAKNVCNCP